MLHARILGFAIHRLLWQHDSLVFLVICLQHDSLVFVVIRNLSIAFTSLLLPAKDTHTCRACIHLLMRRSASPGCGLTDSGDRSCEGRTVSRFLRKLTPASPSIRSKRCLSVVPHVYTRFGSSLKHSYSALDASPAWYWCLPPGDECDADNDR